MIILLLKAVVGSTGGRVAIGVIASIVALKAYGMSREHAGAAKERERVKIAGDANVQKAEKARSSVRSVVKPDDECVRDARCRR